MENLPTGPLVTTIVWADKAANKKNIAREVARRLQISGRDSYRAVTAVLEAIAHLVRWHGQVTIKGFGSLKRRMRKGRSYRHPRTGEAVRVPDKTTIYFKPSANLVETVSPIQTHTPQKSQPPQS